MGRRKLEIKRIKDKSSRLVAFSKRRTGLFKKARQLSVLCDVDVAVVVFSDSGKLYDFCSGGANKYFTVKKYKDLLVDIDADSAACSDVGKGTVVKCLFGAVALGPNLKSAKMLYWRSYEENNNKTSKCMVCPSAGYFCA